jgi:hypothetical protein
MKKLLSILLIALLTCVAVETKAQDTSRHPQTLVVKVTKEGSVVKVPANKVWSIISTGDKEALFVIQDSMGKTLYMINNGFVITTGNPKVELPLILPDRFSGTVHFEGSPKTPELIITEYDTQ